MKQNTKIAKKNTKSKVNFNDPVVGGVVTRGVCGGSLTGSIDSRANVHFRFGGLNQPKKGRAHCGTEAIQSNCRLSRNIRVSLSFSLSVSTCALGRVCVPRPGQLARLNNNFIADIHTDTPSHTHTQTWT